MAVKNHNCDVMAGLRAMPDDYFDCVITSPPYWGLRDYGVEGQLGMEPTLGQHLDAMVRVFAEVHRVMKPTGTLWLNYGDCYAAAPNGRSAAATKAAGNDDRTFRDKPMSTIGGVLKSKDLCMIPNRLAIALQEWGWWCRSECIWAKPNPMPESVRDRPATAHEKVFMLTKAAKYFYNGDAVRQPCVGTSLFEKSTGVGFRYQDANREKVRVNGKGGISAAGYDDRKQRDETGNTRPPLTMRDRQYNPLGRNLHNWEPPPLQVWEIATQGFKDALLHTCALTGANPPPKMKVGKKKAGRTLDGVIHDGYPNTRVLAWSKTPQ